MDAGPASLATGPNGYISDNLAFVSVTLCAPGTNTCQTIDHVEVDTGSVGLRIAAGALSSAMLSALPHQSDGNSQPLGECFQFVDGYAFGSVRQANFQIGGETVAAMPFQVIGDSGAYANVPSSCSAGGGASLVTPQDLSANGIIGLGVTATDCGATCAIAGSQGPAIYYDCPSAGCGASVIEAAATSAPFQQLPNPVAAMAVDNNGVVISLPAAPQTGEASLTGTIYFGIGTQTNNGLGSATVLATTNSASDMGAGLVTATYNGQSLPDSFLDTGSNLYLFADNGIATCTDKTYNGYYCPTTPVQVSPTIATRRRWIGERRLHAEQRRDPAGPRPTPRCCRVSGAILRSRASPTPIPPASTSACPSSTAASSTPRSRDGRRAGSQAPSSPTEAGRPAGRGHGRPGPATACRCRDRQTSWRPAWP